MDLHDENLIIRRILEGTATQTGDKFFDALVVNLAAALDTYGAWVTEYLPQTNQLRAIALWMGGKMTHDFTYDVAGTACETVLTAKNLIHLPDNIITLYPDDDHARDLGAVSYLGIPLMDEGGNIMGHLSVLDRQPMPEQARQQEKPRELVARVRAVLRRVALRRLPLRSGSELDDDRHSVRRCRRHRGGGHQHHGNDGGEADARHVNPPGHHAVHASRSAPTRP